MTKEQAIKMIDEYLLEPNNISPEWVECLKLCKEELGKSRELFIVFAHTKKDGSSGIGNTCLTVESQLPLSFSDIRQIERRIEDKYGGFFRSVTLLDYKPLG